jgi:hypothetical protein
MADENLTAGIKRAAASFVTIERPTILPRRRPPICDQPSARKSWRSSSTAARLSKREHRNRDA